MKILNTDNNNLDQSKIITSLQSENELLREEIRQIRVITETKGCFCKRKFVKQIPSLSQKYNTKDTTHPL